MLDLRKYEPLARRFADSYRRFPPGVEPHEVCVVGNGGPVSPRQRHIFDGMPVSFHEHDNRGKDIGGYEMAAYKIPCDLMLCFGSHVHFWKSGWLDRIVSVFLDNGPGLYGPWAFHQPADHVRTTAFWLSPELLREYPFYVGNNQRYSFEHGRTESITAFVRNNGFPVLQVTWNEVLDQQHWHHCSKEETLFYDQWWDKTGVG
jgi:hypothetical protein